MENQIYPLNHTQLGDIVTIAEVSAQGGIRRRLLDLGFIVGTPVRCVLRQSRGESAAYLVRGTTIALRREDAEGVLVR